MNMDPRMSLGMVIAIFFCGAVVFAAWAIISLVNLIMRWLTDWELQPDFKENLLWLALGISMLFVMLVIFPWLSTNLPWSILP